MQSLIEQQRVDSTAKLSFMHSLDAFMHSADPMQLLTGSSEVLRQCALQTVMKRYKYDQPLLLNASEELTTDRLLTRMREHCRFQIPVHTVSFRSQIKDFLQACQDQVQQGLLIITEAHRLPITTQAALMYLSYLQEKQSISLKVVLICHPVLVGRLGVFSQGKITQTQLADSEQFFLQWMAEQVQKRQVASDQYQPVTEPVLSSSRQLLAQFSGRQILSGLAIMALMVGVTTHGLHHSVQPLTKVVPALRGVAA